MEVSRYINTCAGLHGVGLRKHRSKQYFVGLVWAGLGYRQFHGISFGWIGIAHLLRARFGRQRGASFFSPDHGIVPSPVKFRGSNPAGKPRGLPWLIYYRNHAKDGIHRRDRTGVRKSKKERHDVIVFPYPHRRDGTGCDLSDVNSRLGATTTGYY